MTGRGVRPRGVAIRTLEREAAAAEERARRLEAAGDPGGAASAWTLAEECRAGAALLAALDGRPVDGGS